MAQKDKLFLDKVVMVMVVDTFDLRFGQGHRHLMRLYIGLYIDTKCKDCKRTRGQRPNESQKAVIIDMMKSVGEIASKMWPVA